MTLLNESKQGFSDRLETVWYGEFGMFFFLTLNKNNILKEIGEGFFVTIALDLCYLMLA